MKYLVFLLFVTVSFQYTPQSLYSYYLESLSPINIRIVDPDKYINSKEEMYQKIISIENSRNMNIRFSVISKMDEDYQKGKKDAIGEFGDDFAELVFQDYIDKLYDSMVIVYSIDDRKMRISTGKNVRPTYDDSTCIELLDKGKKYLEKKKYNEAFMQLLDNIDNIEEFKKKQLYYYIGGGIAFVLLFLIVFCGGLFINIALFIFYMFRVLWASLKYCFTCGGRCLKEQYPQLEPEEETKIQRLNRILEEMDKNKNKQKEIFTENCIICLERFCESEEDKKEKENTNNKDKKETTPVNERLIDRDSDVEKINIENPNLNNLEEAQNENTEGLTNEWTKTTLKCGHQFHKKCIAEWLSNHQNCPICREEFNEFKNNERFRQKVMNVQENIHPVFRNISLDFSSTNRRYRPRYRLHRSRHPGINFFNFHSPNYVSIVTYNSRKKGPATSSSRRHRGGGGSSGW